MDSCDNLVASRNTCIPDDFNHPKFHVEIRTHAFRSLNQPAGSLGHSRNHDAQMISRSQKTICGEQKMS